MHLLSQGVDNSEIKSLISKYKMEEKKAKNLNKLL